MEIENYIVNGSGHALPLFQLVRDLLPGSMSDRVHEEFHQSQIEYATRPHVVLADLRTELMDYVDLADAAAGQFGASLAWTATLPGLEIDPSSVTQNERSQELLSRFGSAAANLLTCGLHVHVAVPQARAIHVVDALTTFVPLFVALSANSSQIATRNDAAASHRAAVWAHGFPTSGFPIQFGSWDGFRSHTCLLYTSPSPRDRTRSRMPSSA